MAYDITALSTKLTDSNLDYITADKLNATDAVAVYLDSTTIFVRVYTVNAGTGAVTGVGTEVNVASGKTGPTGTPSIKVIDSSNFVLFWVDSANDMVARLYSVDGSGNITTNGAEQEIQGGTNIGHTDMIEMDSTHFLLLWQGVSGDGFCQIITVDTVTPAITVEGSAFEFNTSIASFIQTVKLSATEAVAFYDNKAQSLAINTTTWAVTSGGTEFAVTTDDIDSKSIVFLEDDGTSYIVAQLFWNNTDNDTYVQTHKINKSTGVVTNFGSVTNIGGMSSGSFKNSIQKTSDGGAIVTSARDLDSGSSYGFQTHTYNSSTGALTLADRVASTGGDRACLVDMGDDRFLSFWELSAQAFDVSTGITFEIAETLALVESETALRGLVSNTTESLSLVETVVFARGLAFTIAESLGLIETWTNLRTRIFQVTDTLGLVEIYARVDKKWDNVTKSVSTWIDKAKSVSTWVNKNKS